MSALSGLLVGLGVGFAIGFAAAVIIAMADLAQMEAMTLADKEKDNG